MCNGNETVLEDFCMNPPCSWIASSFMLKGYMKGRVSPGKISKDLSTSQSESEQVSVWDDLAAFESS